MIRDDVKRGIQIGDNIRKVLLNLDLRLVYAEGERAIANEDYRLYARLGDKGNQHRALRAKARSECYRIYISNINKVKSEVTIGLDSVLSRYTNKYKQIWEMHFLKQATIDEISEAMSYSRESTNKIIQKLRLDLSYNYTEEPQNERKRGK